MNEDEIARGVSRGLRDHQRRQAEQNARSLLAGLAMMLLLVVGFILLVTYG
ncbi:hypothetical protein [Streptomyces sp. NPDC088360]|uniref:hypothetical protein n=1 Tax=Streptomyces sp. NPDC088360 TaxID=3154515 RepID=UPI00344DB3CF